MAIDYLPLWALYRVVQNPDVYELLMPHISTLKMHSKLFFIPLEFCWHQ